MPNWCNNQEYIYGPTKSIGELYRKLDSWVKGIKEPSEENKKYLDAFDANHWLGNVFINAGFDIDKDKIYCRAWLVDWFEYFNDEEIEDIARIEFSSKSAWNSIYESWDRLLGEYFPDCKYGFMSEESGLEYYIKRDPLGIFPGEYIVDFVTCNEPEKFNIQEAFEGLDVYESYGGIKVYLSESDVDKLLTNILGQDEYMTTEDLISKFYENVANGQYGKDNYFGIYKFEEIDE